MNRQKWKITLSQKSALKNKLRTAFPQATQESEQYCDYRLKIPTIIQRQAIIAKQYDNGTFYAEGPNTPEWDMLCELVNSAGWQANAKPAIKELALKQNAHSILAQNYIGQDESGKGDYFGGPVVAGVYLMPMQAKTLETAGIQDSKNLGPHQINEAAKKITDIIPQNAIEIINTPPSVYNALYTTFKSQGKNLNNLLGHLHATVLQRLVDRFPNCEHAIIDQFGKPTDVTSYLNFSQKFNLIQQPKAENYTAVAAASILARQAFVQQIRELEEKYQYRFPLGAGADVIIAARNFVNRYGQKELSNVAKMHFKTTDSL